MPRFVYEGISAAGRRERGEVDGPDEAAAYGVASGLGITVLSVVPAHEAGRAVPWYLRQIGGSSQALRSSSEAALADMLAVLFRARLPLPTIVGIVAETAPDPSVRAQFARVQSRIADGLPFAASVEEALSGLSPIARTMLRLAERTPDPSALMSVFARYLRQREQRRRKVQSALIYPGILIAAALGVVVVVTVYLVPTLEPMFASLNRPLPGGLVFFKSIGASIGHPLFLGFALCLVGSAVFAAVRLSEQTAALLRPVARALPVTGTALRLGELSRITHAADLLLRSGASLPEALRQSATIEGPSPTAALFAEAAEALDQGLTATSIFEAAKGLPPLFSGLFAAGERANALEDVLPSIAEALDRAVEQSVDRNVALLTPILTLVIGGGIGLLIYTVMDAILAVNDLAF